MKTWKKMSSTYLALAEEEIPARPRSIWWRLGAGAALAGVALVGCGGLDGASTSAAVSGDEDGNGIDDTGTGTATGSQTATGTGTDAGTGTGTGTGAMTDTGTGSSEDSLDTTGGTETGDDTTGALQAPSPA
jgi:hypothetical protein